jgi:hypothetical protein
LKLRTALGGLAGAFLAATVLAHSGGLDKYGCHTDHKTGRYHCHGKTSPKGAPEPPVNMEPLPLLAQPISFPVTDMDLVVSIQHLLVALGYLSGQAIPTATDTMDLRIAVMGFRSDYKLKGGDKIDGKLLLQLSEAVVAKCSKMRRTQ